MPTQSEGKFLKNFLMGKQSAKIVFKLQRALPGGGDRG
jgi:hypothetical protein